MLNPLLIEASYETSGFDGEYVLHSVFQILIFFKNGRCSIK